MNKYNLVGIAEEKSIDVAFKEYGCIIQKTLTAADVRRFRENRNLSLKEFSDLYEIPLNILASWEDGTVEPDLSIAKLYNPKNAFDPVKSEIISSVGSLPERRIAA